MTRFLSKLSIGVAALLVTASVASAQTTPQAPPAAAPKAVTAPPAAAPKADATKAKGVPKKASTPEGIECSAQADAKGLHGKERTKFRKKCISDIKKAAAAAKGAPAKK
ncbi:MAG: PsiF family protein [Hyphomicrobiaceae bacterium]